MPRNLKLYITGVVTLSAVALLVATRLFPAENRIALTFTVGEIPGVTGSATPPASVQVVAGILFWTVLTLLASAVPVRLPRGTHRAVAMAPIVAAMSLGGPAVGGWVAAIGTTEMRELRGRIPWYGSLANHAGATLPAIAGGVAQVAFVSALSAQKEFAFASSFVGTLLGAAVFVGLNVAIASGLLALRTGQLFNSVLMG